MILSFAEHLSCYKDQIHLKKTLETSCFWDYLNKKESKSINSGYKFKNNECQYFEYNFINRKRTDSVSLFYEGDQILPKTWAVKGDTALDVQGFLMKILNYNDDTVTMKLYNSHDTVYLFRNCKTISKSKYW
jgi:hypothetical protein